MGGGLGGGCACGNGLGSPFYGMVDGLGSPSYASVGEVDLCDDFTAGCSIASALPAAIFWLLPGLCSDVTPTVAVIAVTRWQKLKV